jgi:hypothetical protein
MARKNKAESIESEATPETTLESVESAETPFTRVEPKAGRGWTTRTEQPVEYRRAVIKDAMGKELITFKFELPKGKSKPDDDVVNVMRNHKYYRNGEPYGLVADAKENSESFATGLTFKDLGPRVGKVWILQNDQMGRTVADSIDQSLDGIAQKSESIEGPTHF